MEKKLPVVSCQLRVNTGELRASAAGHAAQARPLNVGSSGGFTLIELMVSIALVVIIMLGIGKVFKLTSDTVGGGMAISSMARDDRAAQVTMQNDFAAAANDSPVFMILSERTGAFLTAADKTGDLDGDPMTVPDYQGVENDNNAYNNSPQGSRIAAALYGDRNHRVDRIGFFARGQFTRQTSDNNQQFTPGNPQTTSEAYIWYGHVRMPGTFNNAAAVTALNNTSNHNGVNDIASNVTPAYPLPGYKSPTNNTQVDSDPNNSGCYENNPIASNWVLGRVAIGMADAGTLSPTTPSFTSLGVNAGPLTLAPFGQATVATFPVVAGTTVNGGTSAPYYPIGKGNFCLVYSSRYDLAATTINEFRSIVSIAWDANQSNPAGPAWWWPMVYEGDFPTTKILQHSVALRYICNPYVDKPITGTGMAGAVPYFVPHVTQFIVEFAGDYLTQDDPMPIVTGAAAGSSGYIEDVKPDGKLDFYYDKSADTSASQTLPNLWVRKIRWYGLPRDIGGFTTVNNSRVVGPDGTIPSPIAGTNFTLNTDDPNKFVDVLPLRDIEKMALLQTSPPNFEAEIPFQREDYAKLNTTNDHLTPTNGLAGDEHYYCIWRNSAPKLVRVLMKIDDPNSRVRQGRWIEQVFAVQ